MAGFNRSDRVGDIVTEYPGAAAVFQNYGVDFCCGGNKSLGGAIDEAGVNEADILNDLQAVAEKSRESSQENVDWRTAELSRLLDHIVNRHHAFLKRELPHLAELTNKILWVHGQNHPELTEVHRLFGTLKLELEEHLLKEERQVFPTIRNYAENNKVDTVEALSDVIGELEDEHEAVGNLLRKLRATAHDYTLPDDACASFEATYRGLEALEQDIFQHVHLENNILHPRLRKAVAVG